MKEIFQKTLSIVPGIEHREEQLINANTECHGEKSLSLNDGTLNAHASYFVYRGYVLRKLFAEFGVGGALTRYEESRWHTNSYSYTSATFLRPAAKISLGIEAQANFIGFSIYATRNFLGNGVRDSGDETLYTLDENKKTLDDFYHHARSRTNADEFCMAITFAL